MTTGRKNAFINGAMRIDQRNDGAIVAGTASSWAADRWFVFHTGGGAQAQRMTVQAAGLQAPSGLGYVLRRRIAPASVVPDQRHMWRQRIEGVETYAGQRVTLSWEYYATAKVQATLKVRQNFGSGGSSARELSIPLSLPALTAGRMSKRSVSFNVPALAGAVIGAGSYLEVAFEGPPETPGAAVVDTYHTGLLLERGSAVTEFEHVPLADDLAACSRYFSLICRDAAGSVIGVGQAISASLARLLLSRPPMRAAMSVTFSGSFNVATNAVVASVGTVSASNVRSDSLDISFASVSGSPLAANNAVRCTTGGRVALDAEL